MLDNRSCNNENNTNSTTERTKVFRGSKKATEAIIRFVSKATKEINACLDSTGPSVMIEVASIKKARIDAKRRGVRLRYITEITNDNIHHCKELLGFVDELRHLNGIKGNFELCDFKEYVATATLQEAQPITELIYSNVRQIIEQEQYVFDTFWSKAIPSEERIREIEEGTKPVVLEFIRDPLETQKLEWDLLSSSSEEIQMIYSTVNAFYIQDSVGVTQLLSRLAKNGINVRLIAPIDPTANNNNILNNLLQQDSNIHIRDIKPSSIPIRFKCLIVDRKHSLVMELKDDSKKDFESTIGLSTYSNSIPTVLSYASIFETLWQQTELHEELKRADHIKNEFINIAAHELRTPIMPIIAGLEMIEDKLGDKIQDVKKELEIIDRNAIRLQKLAEDILQISRIESGAFQINTEDEVDITCLILDVIKDIEKKYKHNDKKDKVSISFVLPEQEEEGGAATAETHDSSSRNQTKSSKLLTTTTISCDRPKITEVLFNVIDNAIKFTDSGTVSIHLEVDYYDHPHSHYYDHANNHPSVSSSNKNGDEIPIIMGDVIISVTDSGQGIDASIKDRLFEKFVTTSNKGTGLGLYLSKKIVELHGGKMWAMNNLDGKKGATFTFRIPIKKKQKLS